MAQDPKIGPILDSPAVGMPAKREIANAYLADAGQEAKNLAI